MRRIIPLGSAVLAAALLLGGCGLLPSAPPVDPPATDSPSNPSDTPTTGAPAGFEEFSHCEFVAPADPWVWVDGFPAAEFIASGATADCGDTWPQSDGESFVNITANHMTLQQIDDFGAALEASGYQLLFDDFIPGTMAGDAHYGAREYYLDGISDGGFTRLELEIFPAFDDDTFWTTRVDYLSPLTRHF